MDAIADFRGRAREGFIVLRTSLRFLARNKSLALFPIAAVASAAAAIAACAAPICRHIIARLDEFAPDERWVRASAAEALRSVPAGHVVGALLVIYVALVF